MTESLQDLRARLAAAQIEAQAYGASYSSAVDQVNMVKHAANEMLAAAAAETRILGVFPSKRARALADQAEAYQAEVAEARALATELESQARVAGERVRDLTKQLADIEKSIRLAQEAEERDRDMHVQAEANIAIKEDLAAGRISEEEVYGGRSHDWWNTDTELRRSYVRRYEDALATEEDNTNERRWAIQAIDQDVREGRRAHDDVYDETGRYRSGVLESALDLDTHEDGPLTVDEWEDRTTTEVEDAREALDTHYTATMPPKEREEAPVARASIDAGARDHEEVHITRQDTLDQALGGEPEPPAPAPAPDRGRDVGIDEPF